MVDAAVVSGTWTVLDDAEALIEHPLLTAALDASPTARTTWDATSPSRRKFHLTQIAMAKQDATRLKRVEAIVAELVASAS